jgi:hypothetical protein
MKDILPNPSQINSRLEQLSALNDGWLDGSGIAPDTNALQNLGSLFQSHYDKSLPIPYIYPTADGGLQLEWSPEDWEATLELNLQTFDGDYQALKLSDGTSREECVTLGNPDGWLRLNQLIRQTLGQVLAA